MTTTSLRLLTLLTLGAWLVSAAPAMALDSVHVITIALRATAESDPSERGDVITTKPVSSRISTLDVIQAIGDAKSVVFNSRARLLLIRHNVGEETENTEVLIRQTGLADCPVDNMVIFDSIGSTVQYGTFNSNTERERTTLLYIGSLVLDIPYTAQLNTSGPVTEKRASVRIGGVEVNAGLSSLVAKIAGDGFIQDDGEIFVVIDGTLTVGVGKLVEP